jgi:hypothetical protein
MRFPITSDEIFGPLVLPGAIFTPILTTLKPQRSR